MKKIKLFKILEIIIIGYLLYLTSLMTIEEFEDSKYCLFIYNENYLIKKFNSDESKENMYFIAQKIKIIDIYDKKNYMNFLKVVSESKSNFKIDDNYNYILLSGYAKNKLNNQVKNETSL